MSTTEPSILYMVLILPSLFGLTLVGEGLHKVLNSQFMGWVSIVAGVGFIGVVVVAYFLLSGVL